MVLKTIRAHEARIGMYVRGFEGNWLQHPFWWARFVIRTEKKLERVRASAVDVVIDTGKGADVSVEDRRRTVQPASAAPAPRLASRRPDPQPKWPVRPVAAAMPARVQPPVAFGKADKARATALAQRSNEVVKALFGDARLGRSLPTARILSVVDDIASMLELNSGAFISVTRLKSKNDATYTHSVAVCALMIGLAREVGLLPVEVQAMGTAGLLHDVGKVSLDESLLRGAEGMSEAELAEFRRHPELGHAALSKERGLPHVALDVCLNHHERCDGSGYPARLTGDAISRAARMAMICDAYETMTSKGPSGAGMKPGDAIAAMQADGDGEAYDAALLFSFMRSIGVFPAGTLVRLRSNRLAVVLPSAGEDRRPTVRAFYATVETRFVPYADVALSDRLTDDQVIGAEDADGWFADDWSVMCADILKGRALAPVAARAA